MILEDHFQVEAKPTMIDLGLVEIFYKELDQDLVREAQTILSLDESEMKELLESVKTEFLRHPVKESIILSCRLSKFILQTKTSNGSVVPLRKISPFKLGNLCGVCFRGENVHIINYDELSRFDFGELPF